MMAVKPQRLLLKCDIRTLLGECVQSFNCSWTLLERVTSSSTVAVELRRHLLNEWTCNKCWARKFNAFSNRLVQVFISTRVLRGSSNSHILDRANCSSDEFWWTEILKPLKSGMHFFQLCRLLLQNRLDLFFVRYLCNLFQLQPSFMLNFKRHSQGPMAKSPRSWTIWLSNSFQIMYLWFLPGQFFGDISEFSHSVGYLILLLTANFLKLLDGIRSVFQILSLSSWIFDSILVFNYKAI